MQGNAPVPTFPPVDVCNGSRARGHAVRLVGGPAGRVSHRVLALALAAAFAGFPYLPAEAKVVGRAGAINPAVQSGNRIIELGQDIVYRQRIQTSASGTAQILFVDKTTLNVGPNSDLVIDEFVYSPENGTGRIAATLTRGALRFVGGQTSHTEGATIKTPAATIGIRGGVANIEYDPKDRTFRVSNMFGRLTVAGAGGIETISRPGFGISGSPAGMTPPTRVSATDVAAMNKALTSGRGQTGGASKLPTDRGASDMGLGLANAGVRPQDVRPANQPKPVARESADFARAGVLDTLTQFFQQAGAQQQELYAVDVGDRRAVPPVPQPEPTPEPEPEPPAPPAPAVRSARAFRLAMPADPALGSGVPYLPAGFVAAGTFTNSGVLGYGGGTTGDGKAMTTSRVMQAGLNITGSGAGQVSTIYVMTGTVNPSNGGTISYQGIQGGVTATTRRAANLGMGRASGSVSGPVTLDADYVPLSGSVTQNGVVGGVQVPRQASYFPDGGGALVDYAYAQNFAQAQAQAGLGVNRPATSLIGFASGVMETYANPSPQGGGTPVGSPFPFLGVVAVALNSVTSQVAAFIGGSSAYTTGSGNTFDTGSFQLGQTGATDNQQGTYVDYDHFAAREATQGPGGPPLGEVTASDGSIVPLNAAYALFVTSQAVNAGGFLAAQGVTTPCQCDYTRWGFWSIETRRSQSASNPTVNSDRLHLGAWVAGQITDPKDIPLQGVATYTGHAVATIRNGSNEYLAASNFSNTVDFAQRTGIVTINNLDGYRYGGGTVPNVMMPTLGNGQTSNYFFSSSPLNSVLAASGTGSGPTATILGQFYQGAGGPAYEMGGQLTISSTSPNPYIGSGIFLGRR